MDPLFGKEKVNLVFGQQSGGVSETLVKDYENAWLDTSWGEYLNAWEEWLCEESKRETRQQFTESNRSRLSALSHKADYVERRDRVSARGV